MDFFCLPLVFGCTTKIDQEGDPQPRICPRCHNASVFAAKTRDWFTFCFVPLIPFRAQHIWKCSICQWDVNQKQPSGWEPARPGWGPPPGPMSPQPTYPHH